MAEPKTKPTGMDVGEFLNSIEDEKKRADSFAILEMMQRVTKAEPKMWGSSIIGFGNYRYRYASGRENEWPLVGFSPRKQNLTLYIMSGFDDYESLLRKLGKYKTGKACLYINKMEDIDRGVLNELIRRSVEHMRQTNPTS